MKQRTVFLTVAIMMLGRPFVVAAQQQDKKAPSSIESRWEAKILKVSRPDSVTIHQPPPAGQIRSPIQRNEKPAENRRWLVLRVDLKAPPQSEIDTEEINIVDEASAMYPALGRHFQEDTFVLFTELPLGLALGPPPIFLANSTGKAKLASSGGSSEMSLLFSIPAAVKALTLQIRKGAGVRVPIP